MFPEKPAKAPNRPRRVRVEQEEERAWVSFYARAPHDSAVAAEVLAQLEADPELKRDRLALYLCCKESVQTHKVRTERNRRIGHAVRLVFRVLFARPVLALGRAFKHSGSLAIECLPEPHLEATAIPASRPRRSPALVKTAAPTQSARRPVETGNTAETGLAGSVAPDSRAATNAA
jgi:hypothetical protein